MASILSLSGAFRALLLRFDTHGQHLRRIATANQRQFTLSPQYSSFADCLLGANQGNALPGSVWFYTDMQGEPGFRDNHILHQWVAENDISEIILIVLGSHDLLELHFSERLRQTNIDQLKKLGAVLSPPWRRRQAGLVAKTLANKHHHRSILDRNIGILNVSNPTNLSRCEYRVCHLLSLGLSISKISDELSVTKSTARTHLRHIYAKTGAAGQMELLFFLLSGRQETEDLTSLSARTA